MRTRLSLIPVLTGLALAPLALRAQSAKAVADSTFRMLTLPELQNYRVYYVEEREALQEEKRYLIQRGIEDGERLLAMNPDPEMVDEVLIRLADLYYYRDKDLYLDRMAAWDEAVMAMNGQGSPPAEPKLDCDASLAVYQRIIDEFPESDLVDDAIYNKGFLFEEMGDHQRANQIYLYLTEAYPQSNFVPEAFMRLGEFFFNPPVSDLERAIAHYKRVAEFTSSPRYSEALYKLGWSYYRLSQYPEAISYFTTLIEDIELTEKLDAQAAGSRADLKDEAIEYVAISFHDFGGTPKAVEYLEGIHQPTWGAEVLRVLGDVYMNQKEEYANAIGAFQALLAYAPHASNAPQVARKIVDCHVALEQDVEAIAARDRLFKTYRKDGEWWNSVVDDAARLKAYTLSEAVLRENINAITAQAEKRDSAPIYEKAVSWAGDYLEAFPENSYAYMIRWNRALILDTKLHQFHEALEEYLSISLVYNTGEFEQFAREKGLATIQDAAENAIVVGDSLVQRERRGREESVPILENGTPEATPLTPAEELLTMAYDNYIKLYPFAEKTPTILANAGALHYTHGQFTKALQYFRTLVKYFPESEQIKSVQYSILESYFGKKDYESAEILAKRIADNQGDPELKEKAVNRWAEAIFYKAEELAAQGEALKAAREYYRVALEVPGISFADRALFNAGREFEKAQHMADAARAYEYLRLTYPQSPLVLDAINNLAVDYGELGDASKAAQRYEIFASLTPDTAQARDALYNAHLYFEQSSDTAKAVETARRYAEQYPKSADAPLLLFKAATLALAGGNPLIGVELLKAYPDRFPNSSLGVESLWRAGDYWDRHHDAVQAEALFDRCLAHHDALTAKGLEGDEFHAADALLRATRMRQQRYAALTFRQPETTLQTDVRQATDLRRRLTDEYTRVVAFKTRHLPEAVFRLGEVVEQFGRAWARQELPALLDPTERTVRRREIGQGTARFFGEALGIYQSALGALGKVESEIVPGTDSTSQASADTLRWLVSQWRGNTQDKITEMLFRMAQEFAASIDDLLAAPIPADLDAVARLEYRNQVLYRAVKPQVDLALAAHKRNLETADSLSIVSAWCDSSRVCIAELATFMGEEYGRLSGDVLAAFRLNSGLNSRAVFEAQQQPHESVLTAMLNLNALYKNYAKAALLLEGEAFGWTDFSGQSPEALARQVAGMATAMADSVDAAWDVEEDYRVRADSLFQLDASPFYEEALTVFEDNGFDLDAGRKTVLETAYELIQDKPNAENAARTLALRLLHLDKAYVEKYNLPVMERVIAADTLWQVATMPRDNWTRKPEIQGWTRPSLGLNRTLVWWRAPVQAEVTTPAPDTLYFRRFFRVPGKTVAATLRLSGGLPEQCWVNGVLVTVGASEEPCDIESPIQSGVNVIAFKGPREVMVRLSVEARIRYVPFPESPAGGVKRDK